MDNEHMDIGEVLQSLRKVPTQDLDAACTLFDAGAVTLVEEDIEGLEAGTLVYHLETDPTTPAFRALASRRCAFLEQCMDRMNGVILGTEHTDLRCSFRTCRRSVCPVGLAALFVGYQQGHPEEEIPLYSAHVKQLDRSKEAVRRFRRKWADRLHDSEAALNLLLSEREDDFAGALVVDDESYLDEFLDDLSSVLADMGKIRKSALKKSHLRPYLAKIDASEMRFRGGDENLPGKCLLVFDRVGEFASSEYPIDIRYPYNETARTFMVERLARIVDQRYVLVTGSSEEIASFCSLDSRFLHTFDQHRIQLKAMPVDDVYKLYLSYLDREVRAAIKDEGSFASRFKDFVSFNQDSLPYRGREMADYLAKQANSIRKPELPLSRYQNSSLDEMLDAIVGLSSVKGTIRQLEQYAMFRRGARADGRTIPAASMHMFFVGDPGTGKTMMGKIVATMLYKIGIIQQNKLHEVTAKDLIGKYVGHTDKITHEEVEKALGGILFIDEAYALAEGGTDSSYGGEAIAELVKSMDEYKDRLIVIFAGYEKEMGELREVNPGLSSRIGYTFRFENYSTDELLEIFERATTRAGFACDAEALSVGLREMFDYHRRFRNFGNGRFVMEVLHRMIVKHATGLATGGHPEGERYVLTMSDVPSRQELNDVTDWSPRTADELLAPLVGIDTLKEKVRDIERVVGYYEQAQKRGLRLPSINLHMVFTGNPGTGKTTVARIVGQILFNVGALPTNKFIEVEAQDLARWRSREGQTSVERYLRDAMGGVLFVDEAYALTYLSSGQEIIAALVKAMEDHKGDFVVMFAGYEDEMREFVGTNPGLASRIGYQFAFEDYGTDDLEEIFERKMGGAGLDLADGAKEASRAVFKYFHSVEDFGNGRFVDKLVQETIAKHAGKATAENFERIGAQDIPSIEELCKLVSMPVYAPSDVSGAEARHRVALHEMGHAICSLALTGETNISLVTIEQEGNGALGYVEYKAGGNPLPTAVHLRNRICTLMGGIAAEELLLGTFSAGGSDDLRQATNLAALYVGRYGMSEAGFVQYVGEGATGRRHGSIDVSKLPADVRSSMDGLMRASFDHAKETIRAQRGAYDSLVEVLEREGTISGERIMELWDALEGGDA